MNKPEQIKDEQGLERAKQIAWGQAHNLATDIIGIEANDKSYPTERIQHEIRFWRDWFYQELMSPYEPVCQACGGISVYGGEKLVNGTHPTCLKDQRYKAKENGVKIK